MNNNEAKDLIYAFLKSEINAAYPDLFPLDSNNACSKVFWDRVKHNRPNKPYIMLTDQPPQKIYRRFEQYRQDNQYKVRKEMRMHVTFSVYTIATDGNLAASDRLASNLIEFIQDLFTEKESTFIALHNQGVTINELESSDIRDLSEYEQTNQEFRKEIDIAFEYLDITDENGELGRALNVNIRVDNTTDYINGDYAAENQQGD